MAYNSSLTLVSSGTGTKPGATGSIVFDQIISPGPTSNVRRVASTAGTTPQLFTVQHAVSGTGFRQRCRSNWRYDFTRADTDPTVTGGIVPAFSIYGVLDRPLNSGGFITTAHIQDGVGWISDFILGAGNLAKFLNQEF